jgi:DNA invertase Pin-like site-specific DNA recombinase
VKKAQKPKHESIFVQPPAPSLPYDPKKLRVGLYARVSTRDKGQDPEMQLREMRDLCVRNGWSVYWEFTDFMTGAEEDRPQLKQLMVCAWRRYIDVVMVYKLDRLGRSLRHLVNVLSELEGYDVQFVSVHDALDFTTPSGRLMFHVIAAMAEFERDLIRERVTSGMANAKAKGIHLGRPRIQTIEMAERIIALRSEGTTWRAIGTVVGLGESTVRRIAAACLMDAPKG